MSNIPEPEETTADVLERCASFGFDGADGEDRYTLLNKAASELRAQDAEIRRLREVITDQNRLEDLKP